MKRETWFELASKIKEKHAEMMRSFLEEYAEIMKMFEQMAYIIDKHEIAQEDSE